MFKIPLLWSADSIQSFLLADGHMIYRHIAYVFKIPLLWSTDGI